MVTLFGFELKEDRPTSHSYIASLLAMWVVTLVGIYALRRQAALDVAREELKHSTARSASIDSEYFKYTAYGRVSSLAWDAFHSIVRNKDYIYLFIGKKEAIWLPRRAFETQSNFDEIYNDLEAFRSHASAQGASLKRIGTPTVTNQLTISFDYTAGDLSKLLPRVNRLTGSQTRRWLRFSFLPISIIFAGIGIQWRSILLDHNYNAALYPIGLAAMYTTLIFIMSRRRQGTGSTAVILQTLTISDQWLVFEAANSWTLYYWYRVVDIQSDANGIYIVISKLLVFAIPRSAFRDEVEQTYFADSMQRYRKGLAPSDAPSEDGSLVSDIWTPAPSSVRRM